LVTLADQIVLKPTYDILIKLIAMKKGLFALLALLIIGTSFHNSYASVIIPSPSSTIEPDPALVKAAAEAFRSLPRKEKMKRFKEAKKEIKAFKAARKAGMEPDTNTLLLAILALFLPPLAVYLHQGETNNKFWITLLLFVLGLIGGFIFSWFLLLASIVYALIIILGSN
jgi:uncharacterized membrane protein YqaE (UPF0057 family)